MTVIWTETAKFHWKQATDYIAKEFGISAVESFIEITNYTVRQISELPNSGPIEPLLSDRTFCHRSIVFAKHSKLVYSVFDDYVLINDYWDTRQESENLKKRL